MKKLMQALSLDSNDAKALLDKDDKARTTGKEEAMEQVTGKYRSN